MKPLAPAGIVLLMCFVRIGVACITIQAADYYVSPDGNDDWTGGSQDPFATISRAASIAVAGDTIHVQEGNYPESVHFIQPGSSSLPIRIIAEGHASVDASGYDWGIFIDGYEDNHAEWVLVDGFEVSGAARGGIRISWADHVTIRNTRSHHNGRWGIFTDFADDTSILNCECDSNADEHGIYISNSSDRPVIEQNDCHHNGACGIQINADPQMGGDGITTGAVIENNICRSNGSLGGAAINLASVRNSIIDNNLIIQNTAGGIAAWGDGNGPEWGCKQNRFLNNIVYFEPGSGRWCISLKEGSTGCCIANNILIGGGRGAIEFSDDSASGMQSDYNILFSAGQNAIATMEDGPSFNFSEWQAAGYDPHSRSVSPDIIFRNLTQSDFHHAASSPGIDSGDGLTPGIPPCDIEGTSRFDDPSTSNTGSGSGIVDMGCYEYNSGAPEPTPTPRFEDLVLGFRISSRHISEGNVFSLDLDIRNPGPERRADLYILLEIQGSYWFYPDWRSGSEGLDYERITVEASGLLTVQVIPQVTIPRVEPGGPFLFYSASFSEGTLSTTTLISNIASEFLFIE